MNNIVYFLSHGVWQIKINELSPFKKFWVRFLRILLLTRKVFTTNQLQQGASTLTYYSLLGLVPMIVILLGIARGFSQENLVTRVLFQRFSGQKEILTYLINFSKQSLSQLANGFVATIGILVLLWSVIKILRQIEFTFNLVWEVKKGRPFIRQFSDYLAMLLFSPIIFIIANAFTFYLSGKISVLKDESPFFQEIHPVLFILFNLISYILTSSLFTFFYMFMPNTKVNFRPAVYAGLIASLVYQIIQYIYFAFQIGVTKYNAIYGTFAAIPLFLIWLHLSWVILLLGAKITFAFQNVDAYEFITEDFQLSRRFERLLSLRIAHFCIKEFCLTKKPPTSIDISNKLEIPLFLVHQLIHSLIDGKVLNEVKLEDEVSGYQPAREPNTLTIKQVVDMIETKGQEFPLPKNYEYNTIFKNLEKFNSLIEKSDANIPLKDI